MQWQKRQKHGLCYKEEYCYRSGKRKKPEKNYLDYNKWS